MNLKTYIKQTGTSQKKIALALTSRGVRTSQGLVSQWINGDTRITLQAAVELEAITNGAVSVYDWLPAKAAA